MKVEPSTESLDNSDLNHLYLFFYLIPILGFFPSLWTLYRGTRGLGLETRDGGARGWELGTRTEQGKMGMQGEKSYLYEAQSPSLHHPITPSPHPLSSLQPLTSSHSPSHQPLASSPSLTISRLSVTLAFAWLLGYLLLNIGAETSEFLTLRLLVLNSLLTSGYFLVSIWLMVRLASGSSVRLPGFSSLAERVFGKHLS